MVLKAFVAGRNLDAFSREEMQRIFNSVCLPASTCTTAFGDMPTCKGAAISENGQQRLGELARLLLLDVLLNNGDRLPLIHANRGNAGNVMLCRGNGQVVAIDSAASAINKAAYPEQYQAYLERVRHHCAIIDISLKHAMV